MSPKNIGSRIESGPNAIYNPERGTNTGEITPPVPYSVRIGGAFAASAALCHGERGTSDTLEKARLRALRVGDEDPLIGRTALVVEYDDNIRLV